MIKFVIDKYRNLNKNSSEYKSHFIKIEKIGKALIVAMYKMFPSLDFLRSQTTDTENYTSLTNSQKRSERLLTYQ